MACLKAQGSDISLFALFFSSLSFSDKSTGHQNVLYAHASISFVLHASHAYHSPVTHTHVASTAIEDDSLKDGSESTLSSHFSHPNQTIRQSTIICATTTTTTTTTWTLSLPLHSLCISFIHRLLDSPHPFYPHIPHTYALFSILFLFSITSLGASTLTYILPFILEHHIFIVHIVSYCLVPCVVTIKSSHHRTFVI